MFIQSPYGSVYKTKFGDYSASLADFREREGSNRPLPQPTKPQKSSTVVGLGDWLTKPFYSHWHTKYRFQPFWPNFELSTSLRETKKSKIFRNWSPKRTAFFKSPLTFDNDLLITGDTCSFKINPFTQFWDNDVNKLMNISKFEILTTKLSQLLHGIYFEV